MRIFILVILISALTSIRPINAGQEASSGRDSTKAKEPRYALELVTSKMRFEQGDPVMMTLRFTSSDDGVRIAIFQPGLVSGLSFSAKTKDGTVARDIAPSDVGGGSGRDVVGKPSIGHPFDFNILLNEYTVFDNPGTYHITAMFRKVTSAPLVLEILPSTLEHRKQRMTALMNAIQIPKDANAGDEQRAAAKELGCMLDERTIPILLANIHCNPEAVWALQKFKDMTPVKEGILKFLDDSEARLESVDIPYIITTLTLAEIAGHGPATNTLDLNTVNGFDAVYEKCKKVVEEKVAKRIKH